jgi:DNA processing protein
LYYIWDYDLIKTTKIIWIVGPREITPFIKKYLDLFFQYIKDYKNIAIVSGLADGTDTYAHKLAIKHNIPTIAVLGFWIAKALNWTTRHLINEITQNNWLILSEFKLKQEGSTWTFPQRNRIIAGLSDIIFSPQAKEKSWTLITLEDAIKIDIPVYSCFSHIEDEFWKWTNKLISQWKIKGIYDFGKFLDEILQKLKLKKEKAQTMILWLNNIESTIVENIKKWNNTIEKISLYSWLETNEILNTLSLLEIKGIIENNWNEIVLL